MRLVTRILLPFALLTSILYAQPAFIDPSNQSSYAFKTINDIVGDSTSGISIHNNDGTGSLGLTGI